MVIAIDGPAGSGKSTIAKLLAERLGYTYINSGNLYRALTLACSRAKIEARDEQRVIDFAQKIVIDYQGTSVFVDGENFTCFLHSDDVDTNVASFSSIVPVRHLINEKIKKISQNKNIVVEGRDMTTVVFPNAEHRFYIDASAEQRAKRRFNQDVSNLSLSEIQKSIEERDAMDRNKVEGSLKIGEGVVYIDTSLLTIEQSYGKLIDSMN